MGNRGLFDRFSVKGRLTKQPKLKSYIMKIFNLLFCVILLFGVVDLNAKDLSFSEVLKPEIIESIMAFEVMEQTTYTCSYEVSFTISAQATVKKIIGIGGDIEVTCKGSGDSEESESAACEAARKVLKECLKFWNLFR